MVSRCFHVAAFALGPEPGYSRADIGRVMMAIAVEKFGDFEGRRVDQFTLKGAEGVEVDIINYGVAVRDWRVPVKGGTRQVVLGFDDFPAYASHSPHLGSLAGRVANRIGGATFEVEGKTYKLPANERTHMLHGGPEGLGRIVWTAEPDAAKNAVRFTHRSPDGAMGFPGNVDFTAVYSLNGKTLRLDLLARSDKTTPISMVQHQYFNLGTTETVLDHHFKLNCNAFTETDEDLIPTGAILPVAHTQYDLKTERTLRDRAGKPIKYDVNMVLDQGRDLKAPVAVVQSPERDLTLKLWTDRPGLQFYNGVYTDIPVPGLSGKHYGNH
jgi:aldose 1-epimerase